MAGSTNLLFSFAILSSLIALGKSIKLSFECTMYDLSIGAHIVTGRYLDLHL